MRPVIMTAVVLGTVMFACTATDDGPQTGVPTAPFHTSLAEAQAAAGAGQHIVIDFYTDW